MLLSFFAGQVMTFPSTCGACAVRCETRMYVTSILSLYLHHYLDVTWHYGIYIARNVTPT